MRVLIIHDYGTLNGGAEHVSQALRDGLRRRGHDARLFTSSARPLHLDPQSDYSCFGTMGAARKVLQVCNPMAVTGLRQALGEFRPEVVHVRMFLTQLSPMILPLLREIPSLLHVVNYNLICPLNTKLLPDGSPCHRRAGRSCYRSGCLPLAGLARAWVQSKMWDSWESAFDRVIANSDWVRRRLLADGVRADETIWNGVPQRQPRPPLETPPAVGFAGRLIHKKGVDVLLDAMKIVHTQLPAATLTLAGDGPRMAEIRDRVAGLGLTDVVRLLGHRSRTELEGELERVWVQAVPSRWEEPFGIVAAEASMRGTAVVASDAGGLSEQVVDGKTGYTVPPGDPAALADRLLAILRDRELAERLGEAGRQHALAHFTEDRFVESFVTVYRQLLASRAGPDVGGGTARPGRAGAAVTQ